MHREDVRVAKSGRQLDLTLESISYEIHFRTQHLNRHKALVPKIARPIDGRHSATPTFRLYRVAVSERQGEPADDLAHLSCSLFRSGRRKTGGVRQTLSVVMIR
jgi:hypothetical protein